MKVVTWIVRSAVIRGVRLNHHRRQKHRLLHHITGLNRHLLVEGLWLRRLNLLCRKARLWRRP